MLPDEMREKAIELFKQRLHFSQVLATVEWKNVERKWGAGEGYQKFS